MPEILVPFTSKPEWDGWLARQDAASRLGEAVLADVRAGGLTEPLSGVRRQPRELQVNAGNLRESLSAEEMNARKRALLLVLAAAGHAAGWDARADLAVHVPEASTRVARVVAGRFGPGPARRPGSGPKLEKIGLPDGVADAVVVADGFDAVEDAGAAWTELARVLRPGGLVVATPRFQPGRLDEGSPAEAMGAAGRCGWGLPAALKQAGWAEAAVVLAVSSQHGVAATEHPGVFVLVARRPGGPAVTAPLLHPVQWQGRLPEKVCLLVALPRSGTTLTTALFDVHSRFDAVYEPWNAKLLDGAADARLETVLERAKLGREPGRFLFLKETAAQREYVDNVRRLHETMSLPLARSVLMLCRKPAHTFLSEVERRREWWGADVSVNQEQFDLWCGKTRAALRAMLDLLRHGGGSIVCYERMAEDPAWILDRLSGVMGFEVEPQQLSFEKHVDTKKVRGDRNVEQNPAPISADSIRRREAREDVVRAMAAASEHARWFAAFAALHEVLYREGVVAFADLPAGALDRLA